MIESTTVEVLERLGFDKDRAMELCKEDLITYVIMNDNHVFIKGNKTYSGIEGARKYYFERYANTISFPKNCQKLIPEYFELKQTRYLEKKAASILTVDQLKSRFLEDEVLTVRNEIEALRKKYPEFSKNPEFLQINQDYLMWLETKTVQLEAAQPEKVKSDRDEEQNWFKVGLLFATGEIYPLLAKHKNNATHLAKELGNEKGFRPFISDSKGDSADRPTNIFSRPKKITTLHSYCIENKKDMCDEFLNKYNQIEPE